MSCTVVPCFCLMESVLSRMVLMKVLGISGDGLLRCSRSLFSLMNTVMISACAHLVKFGGGLDPMRMYHPSIREILGLGRLF